MNLAETLRILSRRNTLTDSKSVESRSKNIVLGRNPSCISVLEDDLSLEGGKSIVST